MPALTHHGIPIEEYLKQQVAQQLSPARQLHVEGVARLSSHLCSQHGLAAWRGRWAGYLHDLMREWPADRLLKAAREFGIVTSEVEEAAPVLLHGPVAAAWARRELGLEDEELLAAVAYHTTGRPQMSVLEVVLLVADAAEPSREYPGVARIRRWVDRDLWQACRLATDSSLRYCLRAQLPIHPLSVASRNWLLMHAGPSFPRACSTQGG